jgi:Ca-activated chloride channel homolog
MERGTALEVVMTFAYPTFFYLALALIPLLAAAGLLAGWRRRRELRLFAEPALAARLTAHLSPARQMLRALGLMGGLVLLALALAGPEWGSRMVEVRRQGVDVLIALDVSRSMLAEDIKPTRLQRAQQELSALIDQLQGDRVGVIAFAGNAQVACPLTSDYPAAKMFMSYLTPYSAAIPGTSLGDAIRLAVQTFPKGGEGYRVLVLLTDGEDHHSNPLDAAQEAKTAGIRILTVGFGTPGGEPIPIRDDGGRVTGYLKDASGRSVVSKLDAGLLKQLADATGGAYWPAASGTLEAERMADLIGRMQKRDLSAGQYGAAENRFQFVLLPALLLLLVSFWLPQRRRSWLLLVPLALLLAHPAQAGVGGDVNQGNRHYHKHEYHQALQKYQDAQIQSPDSAAVQYDLGNAWQRLGKFQEAEQAYQQALKSTDPKLREQAWYNLGNNFMQQQKYAEAVEPYCQALKLAPNDEDAQHNLALALRFLKQPPPKNQKGQGQQSQPSEQNQSASGQPQDQDKGKNGRAQMGQADKAQKGPDDRGQQQADQGARQDTPQDQKGEQARAPKPGEMSPEDAENLLDAVRESEQDQQRQRISGIQDRGKGRVNVPEDW